LTLWYALVATAWRCHRWVDICTVNQHPGAQDAFPKDYFYTTFKEGIQACQQWGAQQVLVSTLALLPPSMLWNRLEPKVFRLAV
jgi:hypothetical protein